MLDESRSKFIAVSPPSNPQPKFSISSLAIRRHIGTLMLTVAAVVVGIFFILNLQVDLLPAITYPRIGLRVAAPGVSPNVAVEEVTKPLEEALSATEGVVEVYSQTREGQISINLFFAPGEDVDQALNDATATLNRSRGRLPDVIEEPRLFKFDPSQLPVYEFALESATMDRRALRVFAQEELARELGIVPGVAVTDVSGGVQEEVRVQLDLRRLQALGVTLQDVLNSLRDRNQDVAGGRLEGEAGEPLTRTVGRFRSVDDLRDLTLEVGGSDEILGRRRIRLRDVANVLDGSEEQRVFVTLNGRPAVKVSVQKQPDANTVTVVEGVKQRIEELKAGGLIPSDMTLIPTLDESVFIKNAIANVVSAGVTGTLLASLAVFFFLGSLRQTFIIITAIPLATLTAVILMKVFGLSINVFSLGGLALGVGIVVDNSIVMLENIDAGIEKYRHRGRLSPSEVQNIAENQGQQVESALLASTTTNLVAVLPFLLIGGFFSLLFNELILTISFSVAASLVLALTLVPMLASRLLGLSNNSGIQHNIILRTFNNAFAATTFNYTRLLAQVLHYRIIVIVLAFGILGGSSFWLLNHIPQEVLPQINTGQANLIAQFPPGTTLETNRKVMEAVDRIILEQPETEYAFTTTGGFLFGTNTNANILRSSSTITVKPNTDIQAYSEKLTRALNQLNLVNIRLRVSPGRVRGIILNNSPVPRADIDVILQGSDEATLEQAGRQVLSLLDEKVQSVRFNPDADPSQPEVQINPNWERLSDLGLNTATIGSTIQTALLGSVPTQLQRENRLVDVRVQLPTEARQSIAQLSQLPIFTDQNRPIQLREIATLDKGRAPGQIQRLNQREVFIIAGNLTEGASLGAGLAEVENALQEVELPQGVRILPSFAAASNRQLQSSLLVLGGLAVFLVFVVMAVQYNSLIDPFVIILTVPLALAGGFLGLYITQTPISAMVLVGIILMVGIVVNNAIVMVELANQIREEFGMSRYAAILKAAPQRLRPILMTTITTVLGLFPLALGVGEGSEFLQPLGVVVFSGLSVATLLTLFIIPCFYVLLHDGLFSPRNQ
ncbi:efflux RND transporter permease subunit [Spirulina subsalsa]|uniref:efflux RND transporter permease subunit n=1 Tax=Spirulina subsalsa TaxID=54311 RepID=UPI00030740BA|nr:efflux RND transporter permease subunit [Spirulina subsalsa]